MASSKEYILMLDVREIVRTWQHLQISDLDAINAIENLIKAVKVAWDENKN